VTFDVAQVEQVPTPGEFILSNVEGPSRLVRPKPSRRPKARSSPGASKKGKRLRVELRRLKRASCLRAEALRRASVIWGLKPVFANATPGLRESWLALHSLSEGGYVRGEPRPKVGTKPSIGKRDVIYKSGVYAQKVLCLPEADKSYPGRSPMCFACG
jgi:hypothetical protein